jgi:tetratricopeptide (TPR) repeat protein
MSARSQRALVLFQQNRLDLAERELRHELAGEPENDLAHALLALCLVKREQFEEATNEAKEAVRLDPNSGFSHYAMAHVYLERNRLKEAEVEIGRAIELDPDDADYVALLASVRFNQGRWQDALAAAERGLALNPHHITCTNLRAMALIKLGRKEEAGATIATALAKDPDNAVTHANQGWALLESGNHAGALAHFREALRIDPETEWARNGIVEALKAKHLVYRVVLRYFLWMSKLSSKAQWVVLLALVFGRSALSSARVRYPALAPFIGPLLILLFVFLVLTWVADPLFNLLLRFDRFGRLVLSRQQVMATNFIGACLGVAVVSFVVYLVTGSILAKLAAFDFGLLAIPVAGAFQCPAGWPRRTMAGLSIFLALFCVVALGSIGLATNGAQLHEALNMQKSLGTAVALSTFAGVGLSQVRPVR